MVFESTESAQGHGLVLPLKQMQIEVPTSLVEASLEKAVNVHGLAEEKASAYAQRDALCKWLAAKVLDFHIDLEDNYILCAAYHARAASGANLGFPKGNRYKLPGQEIENGPAYVNSVIEWIMKQHRNTAIFPVDKNESHPDEFFAVISDICSRMVHIYAIMYSTCMPEFIAQRALVQLNDGFTFLYFILQRYKSQLNIQENVFEPFESAEIKKHMDISKLHKQFLLEHGNTNRVVDRQAADSEGATI